MEEIKQEMNALGWNRQYKDVVHKFKVTEAVTPTCHGLQEANLVLVMVRPKSFVYI